jgi:hypothetical protein
MSTSLLLEFLAQTYYTVILLITSQMAVIVISLMKRKKFPQLKYFHLYPMAGFFQVAISIISMLKCDRATSNAVSELSINLFLPIEVTLVYMLGFRIIKIRRLKSVLKFSLTIYLLYTLYFWLFDDGLFQSAKIIPVEDTVLLLPACAYFLQIFKLLPTLELQNEPAFWINIGVLFAFGCQLPLSILEFFIQKFVYDNFYFYYINFLSYAVLYLFIIRGYLSRRGEELTNKNSTDLRIILRAIQ